MYCEKHGEYSDEYDSCDECDENDDCSYYSEQHKKGEEVKKMRNSKFMKEVENKLSTALCISPEKLSPLLDNFTDNLFNVTKEYMESLIKDEIKILFGQYFDKEIKSQLKKDFKKMLESKICELRKNDKIVITSIQEKILEKLKTFFENDEDYRGSEDELEKVIKKLVNKKTDNALEELKKETIEKFNIEAMKTMMKGMAKQLGSDKRLMKILTSGDFDQE